jgi:8-oxo-dGTP pyrophosphatase MutT (NUDIX family)
MSGQHYSGEVAQKAVICDGGKVLVCRNVGDTLWDLPGGRLHEGESPQQGLMREAREELSIDISVGRPFCVCRSLHAQSGKQTIFIGYECSIVSGNIQADGAEMGEFAWVTYDALKTLPMFDNCREIADEYIRLAPPEA